MISLDSRIEMSDERAAAANLCPLRPTQRHPTPNCFDGQQGFDFRLVPGKLRDPILWGESRMIFVTSMTDLFHADVSDDYIELVCRIL